MSSKWDFEAFRDYVIRHAKRSGRASDQATLATATGIGSDLLGRYFRGEVQPGPKNIQKIQAAIPGTTYEHLMVLAGRATAEQFGLSENPTPPPAIHPLAERVSHLLGESSPLATPEKDLLATLLERVLEPYNGNRRRTA
ncbi:helix-turn-helix domain-containing protein [Plantactinospora sp. CA-294935]|uniref:helix-turn-helix domain-containing protein n=1 Tax=Plantactinospora sp. CA-294935 TaxID=3240012 RepID=UPI003D8D750F